jgi:outer membrane protein OmpA-like peptidoglycan-associated protein
MFGNSDNYGAAGRGSFRKTVCAPYRRAQGGLDGPDAAGWGTAAADPAASLPLSDSGHEIISYWPDVHFREIRRNLERLEKSRTDALGDAGDEEVDCFRIYFDTDSADVRDQGDVIERAMAAIHRAPGRVVLIKGHADRHGQSFLNEKLSRQRAINVARELTRRGVDLACIEYAYFGARQPRLSSLPGVSADQMDRRVEIVIRP